MHCMTQYFLVFIDTINRISSSTVEPPQTLCVCTYLSCGSICHPPSSSLRLLLLLSEHSSALPSSPSWPSCAARLDPLPAEPTPPPSQQPDGRSRQHRQRESTVGGARRELRCPTRTFARCWLTRLRRLSVFCTAVSQSSREPDGQTDTF